MPMSGVNECVVEKLINLMNQYDMNDNRYARIQGLNEKKRTLVLDVLKPHSPPLPDFAIFLSEFDGVEKVDIALVEMDEKTESLRVTITGDLFPYEDLKEHMSQQGAVIHSVDHVVVEKGE
jgi:hypothetical protein